MSEQGAVERWLAWRYLATRQREGFVSFIAIFSLIGIALGVATLIVVLSCSMIVALIFLIAPTIVVLMTSFTASAARSSTFRPVSSIGISSIGMAILPS